MVIKNIEILRFVMHLYVDLEKIDLLKSKKIACGALGTHFIVWYPYPGYDIHEARTNYQKHAQKISPAAPKTGRISLFIICLNQTAPCESSDGRAAGAKFLTI